MFLMHSKSPRVPKKYCSGAGCVLKTGIAKWCNVHVAGTRPVLQVDCWIWATGYQFAPFFLRQIGYPALAINIFELFFVGYSVYAKDFFFV